MTLTEFNEAVAVTNAILRALYGTLGGTTGRPGAALRYAVGDLMTTAPTAIRAATLGVPLLNCFDLAFAAAATFDAIDAVRVTAAAQTPLAAPAIAIVNASIRFALVEQAKILAATTFTSSQDVYAILTRIGLSFDDAIDYAADSDSDPAVFQSLVALRAAVTRDLTTRALSLPGVQSYVLPKVMTAHALAVLLYGDAGRSDEIIAENKVIHPAFMPVRITALSE